jgi:hypothetical protein
MIIVRNSSWFVIGCGSFGNAANNVIVCIFLDHRYSHLYIGIYEHYSIVYGGRSEILVRLYVAKSQQNINIIAYYTWPIHHRYIYLYLELLLLLFIYIVSCEAVEVNQHYCIIMDRPWSCLFLFFLSFCSLYNTKSRVLYERDSSYAE